jgi:hypothetical protein
VKPEADHILNRSAAQLLATIAPLLPTGYAQGTASLLAFMLLMSAQEYERGAEVRSLDNEQMRRLFSELISVVDSPDLRSRLADAADSKDEALTISALNASNGRLRQLLVALQTHVEELPGPAARDAEQRIWEVLKDSAQRRLVQLPAT